MHTFVPKHLHISGLKSRNVSNIVNIGEYYLFCMSNRSLWLCSAVIMFVPKRLAYYKAMLYDTIFLVENNDSLISSTTNGDELCVIEFYELNIMAYFLSLKIQYRCRNFYYLLFFFLTFFIRARDRYMVVTKNTETNNGDEQYSSSSSYSP